MYVHTHIPTHMYTCAHVHVCTCGFAYTSVHCMHMYACTRVCVCVHLHIFEVPTCMAS